jgi:hypothetical protein
VISLVTESEGDAFRAHVRSVGGKYSVSDWLRDLANDALRKAKGA